MSERLSVQQAVIGEILPDIGRRHRGMLAGRGAAKGARRGAMPERAAALARNALRVPQSVVKRVGAGGCHDATQLRRQMNYIIRDEARMAAWSNQIGIERSFGERGVNAVVSDWSSAWRGAPKRGHTDHIILSFPKGTEAETAEAIAREWGREVFGSGSYGDRWRYVAALHHNTEAVHAHYIVEKVGAEHGKFLSISARAEINYDMMRQIHVEIAAEHGLMLNATPRIERGLVENAPRQSDIQAARREGRGPHVEPLEAGERLRRQAIVKGMAGEYRALADLASLAAAEDASGFMDRLSRAATAAYTHMAKGEPIMSASDRMTDMPGSLDDPAARLVAARDILVRESHEAWEAIRAMEAGAERTEIEAEFTRVTRAAYQLLGRDVMADDMLARFTERPGRDPYAVPGAAGLADVAGDEANPMSARAEAARDALRERLARAFGAHDEALERHDTNAEEMAARFVARERSAAEIEAWRPEGDAARAEWQALEQRLSMEARDIAGAQPMERDLLEQVARADLLRAERSDRLADIATLQRLVADIRADMTDGDMDQVAAGRLDPIASQLRDPGMRHAVASELRAIAAVEDGQDPHGRDSAMARDAADRVRAFERAAHAQARREREGIDDDYEL